MAKVTLGPIVTDIARSISTVTFQRGAHGLFSKIRKAPDQTLTSPRIASRAAWAAAGRSWASVLSDEQRNAWLQLTATRSTSHQRIGKCPLMAFSWFTQRNALLAQAGATMLTDPPADDQVRQLTSFTLSNTAPANALTITFDPSPVPANHVLMVWATKAMNAGRMSANSDRRLLAFLPAATTSPQDITSLYTTRLTTPAIGKRVFGFANYLCLTNGVKSIRWPANTLVTSGLIPMLQSVTEISSAELLLLNTTPVALIPSPGAGYVIRPLSVTIKLHAGGTGYTGSGSLAIFWGPSNTRSWGTVSNAAFTDLTADSIWMPVAASTSPIAPTQVENLGMTLQSSGALTLGTGTMTVVIDYVIDQTT